MRATQLIESQRAAAAGGFTEADVDAARQEGADGAFAGALSEASGWQSLIGPTVQSSSALGTITRDQGKVSCDVVGNVPADPDGTSWITVEATTPDAVAIVTEFLGWFQLNAEPTGNVRPFLGFCDGPDLAAADYAVLFGVDTTGTDPTVSMVSKNNGSWRTWDRNSNGSAGALGVRGSICFIPQFSGDATAIGAARLLLDTAKPENSNNKGIELDTAVRFVLGLTGGKTMHLVCGFDLLANEAVAIPTEVDPKIFLGAPPEAAGVSTALTVWLWLGGQSNAIGRSTGEPAESMVGSYVQGSTARTDWNPTDSHSSAAGMLTNDADNIPRGVYERGLGGTSIREQIDEVLPDAISSMQTRGIVPKVHLLWQGERNANDAARAAAYAGTDGTDGELAEYVAAVRTAFPAIEIYLIEVQATAGDYTEFATVNNAMQAMAAAHAYVHVLKARGTVELQGDNLHATSAGQIAVGNDMAAEMVTLGHWDSVA